MKKIEVLLIGGGMTFAREKDYLRYLKEKKISKEKKIYWGDAYLSKKLGKRFEIIRPRMPLKENARYRDWKIIMEKYLAVLGPRYMLIGTSLGGVFLARYLSERRLRRRALGVYLVCPPYDDEGSNEELTGGFALTKSADLSLLARNAASLHLFFSKDDPVVPPIQAEKYRAKLRDSSITVYKSKNGHFQIEKFPEIVAMIKKDARGGAK